MTSPGTKYKLSRSPSKDGAGSGMPFRTHLQKAAVSAASSMLDTSGVTLFN